ncbi:MAG: GTP-binding protein, partial [Coriobacteriia bacterium]|nr:GTP-binding protein [Coriobacteriia bacterium]
AIDRADVALLMVDCTVGVTDQDQRIARFAEERGCGLIVILNKWDTVSSVEERDSLSYQVEERLGFVGYAPMLRISALTGSKVPRVYQAIEKVYEAYTSEISTSALNRMLTEMRDFGHTVNKGGKTLRVHYVTQTRTEPPGFTFFANHPRLADENFKRYVENRLRAAFDLTGTPVILKFRQKD